MRIKKVWAVYFSGTGTTEKTVRRIAAGMAQALDAELAAYDFTTPAARQRVSGWLRGQPIGGRADAAPVVSVCRESHRWGARVTIARPIS